MKKIKGFSEYYITEEGEVFSLKSGRLKKISQWADSRNRYMMVGLIDDNGNRKRLLVHRLVAKAYLENPYNLSDVNHIDKNTKNNRIENLEWVSHRENLNKSYETMSPVRNFTSCSLFVNGEKVKDFQSIKDACRWASEEYNCSYESLNRYLQCGNIIISKDEKAPIIEAKKTRDRNPIIVYYKGNEIGKFKTKALAFNYIKENYSREEFPLNGLSGIHPPAKYKNFEFIRKKCND